jgi:carbamoylphosphate synthase small subunit
MKHRQNAKLVHEDGSFTLVYSFGFAKSSGVVVYNTAMNGYPKV